MGDLLRMHEAELAQLQSLDNGVPISIGRGFRFSASFAADVFDYFSGWIDKLDGVAPPVYATQANSQMFTLKEPIGVVAAITPFNAPVMQFAQKVAARSCSSRPSTPAMSPPSTHGSSNNSTCRLASSISFRDASPTLDETPARFCTDDKRNSRKGTLLPSSQSSGAHVRHWQ